MKALAALFTLILLAGCVAPEVPIAIPEAAASFHAPTLVSVTMNYYYGLDPTLSSGEKEIQICTHHLGVKQLTSVRRYFWDTDLIAIQNAYAGSTGPTCSWSQSGNSYEITCDDTACAAQTMSCGGGNPVGNYSLCALPRDTTHHGWWNYHP